MNLKTKERLQKSLVAPLALLVLFAFCLNSCKKDEEYIKKEPDTPALKAPEKVIAKAHEEIRTIETLLKAKEAGKEVSSHKELEDNSGFEILMNDEQKIVLKKENAFLVNAKEHTDKMLYWTVNNEFACTADGKMLAVQVQQESITPQLRIKTPGNQWQVSTDGGKAWQEMQTLDKKPLIATDLEESSAETPAEQTGITEEEGVLHVKYNGVTYTFPIEKKRPKLPIEYVATHNVNAAGDNFMVNQSNSGCGLFNWYEANGKKDDIHNPTGKNILSAAAFKGYHLPTHEELRCIIPDEEIDLDQPGGVQVVKDNEEEIMVAGVKANYKADYSMEHGVSNVYAIRFKGGDNRYRAAYRYNYKTNPEDNETKEKKMMEITVRYLGNSELELTLADLAKETFWTEEGVEYITRIFPMSGYTMRGKDRKYRVGEYAYHWSSTEQTDWPAYAISMNFYERHHDVTTNAYNEKKDLYAIRLFSNK